jgi:predicted kinase
MNSVVVVTGANFSGKSVYLKQTALIVYMAHVGRYTRSVHKRLSKVTHVLYIVLFLLKMLRLVLPTRYSREFKQQKQFPR